MFCHIVCRRFNHPVTDALNCQLYENSRIIIRIYVGIKSKSKIIHKFRDQSCDLAHFLIFKPIHELIGKPLNAARLSELIIVFENNF